jgi:hypothetical protein
MYMVKIIHLLLDLEQMPPAKDAGFERFVINLDAPSFVLVLLVVTIVITDGVWNRWIIYHLVYLL